MTAARPPAADGGHDPFVVTDADLGGRTADVTVVDGRVAAVEPPAGRSGRTAAGREVPAGGAALVPGLHDHHVHLLATAATLGSVSVAGASTPGAFDRAVAAAHAAADRDGWLRVVGYDEGLHGVLTADRLESVAPERRVRAQHRSGAAWVLSRAAVVEVASAGRGGRAEVGPDGWVHRGDADLVDAWTGPALDLATVGARLASRGVTGVTDATPSIDPTALGHLAAACRAGDLPQRVTVTGGPPLAGHDVPPPLRAGPVKLLVADDDLPSPDLLAEGMWAARAVGRPVAVHCVTRVGLAVAVAAWRDVGAADGDRVEHAAVAPPDLVAPLAGLGVRVVTQPALAVARGDRYLAEVEVDDRPHLWRCRSLMDAGVRVAGSTDAPFGPDDPWSAVAAAVDRRTPSGARLGAGEELAATAALDLFLGRPDDPGGPPRRIVDGAPADLVLLDRPLGDVLTAPGEVTVRTTWVAGRAVHGPV